MWIESRFLLKMQQAFFPEEKSVLIGNPRAQEVADTNENRYCKKI